MRLSCHRDTLRRCAVLHHRPDRGARRGARPEVHDARRQVGPQVGDPRLPAGHGRRATPIPAPNPDPNPDPKSTSYRTPNTLRPYPNPAPEPTLPTGRSWTLPAWSRVPRRARASAMPCPHTSLLASPFTPQPSPLTPHPSPLSLHPSRLIPQPSPLAPQPSPLSPRPSPSRQRLPVSHLGDRRHLPHRARLRGDDGRRRGRPRRG